ncbi:amidohydrolase family protein [Nitrospirillum viridazoti]|uniref:2-amino-3-carboxymuconate-6-semialdehyde decarboxylase n=1 Tax=Nitrospirillum viridazoti CBAmc TaxID=1441467 RepID=A0A248JZ06_9PROT|nr:amidohydrolase family protein [Nitrospirillum amazonense]ASG23942.1 aminocarboxymuconate-semialdehyde decarboxylase [Nitrospirillum amazonense CBAmc]TWB44622.1 aminocarboxymuconate-semialdehyde decarboxylase [Nitrospirillum amazonense]
MSPIQTAACGCGIDVHAHVVPAEFPAYIGARLPAHWPSTAPAQDCHRHVMIDDKVYRTISDRCWDTGKRVADMDAMGLARQVISPMPELLSYWFDAADARQLLRFLNDQIAAMVDESAGYLIGLGAVPLQDMDMALVELEHIVRTLGFAGVEVGSNVNGVPIGHPRFDPFFEACVDLGAAVFVHAVRPTGMDRLVGPPQLPQALAYPSDVGLAAASVITSNLMVRRPNLRIAFSHGGGTLGLLLPRLERATQVFPAVRDSLALSPTEQARRLFFDTLVFDAATLRHLTGLFGDGQLMIGTDYPFHFHDATPVDRIRAAGFGNEAADRLLHTNARRFLALPDGA